MTQFNRDDQKQVDNLVRLIEIRDINGSSGTALHHEFWMIYVNRPPIRQMQSEGLKRARVMDRTNLLNGHLIFPSDGKTR